MALRINDKKVIVAELAEVASRSVSVIAAEYRGLTVAQMTALRQGAKKARTKVRVYRNTLACKAVEGTNFKCLQSALVGPMVLMFSEDEPAAAARMARDFAKDHSNFVVRALVLEGRLLSGDELKSVANLPSRNEALAQLMSVMQGPVVKFVRTLSETYAQLVRVMAAVGDKKAPA